MKKNLLRSFLTFTLLFLISFSFAQTGTLDSSFGVNGKVSIYNNSFISSSLAIQRDGKIVVAATEGAILFGPSNILITRYKENGSIDSTFGSNGIVRTYFDYGNAKGSVATSILIQSDDKILVGGWEYHPSVGPDYFIMVRYLPNGNYDSSFGINGTVTSFVGPFPKENELNVLGLQSDSKIIAAGNSDGYCLVRYKANGVIDSTFGLNGILRNQDTATFGIGDIFIQSDNKIVAAATRWDYNNSSIEDFMITRVLPDGKFDSTFGKDGYVYADFNNSKDVLYSIAKLSNGGIIAAGKSSNGTIDQIAIVKFKSNGTLDLNFGVNGKLISTFGETSATANEVLVQADGKILIAGSILVRLNSNGTVDSTFGVNGKSPDFNYTATQGILQTDQKIVLIASDLLRFKNDTPIIVSLTKNISVTEGNTGTTTSATFNLTLNKAATKQVKVNYHTRNLSAKSGSDYVAKSTTLAFAPGVTSKTITVNVKGDNTVEPNERFALVITDPTNAVLGTDSVICIIKNDDPSFARTTNTEDIKAPAIKIYPNPVKDILIVEGLNTNSKTTLSIVDAQGKIIAITTTTANSVQQNIKQLSAGTYFVKIESNNEINTFKFVKQ